MQDVSFPNHIEYFDDKGRKYLNIRKPDLAVSSAVFSDTKNVQVAIFKSELLGECLLPATTIEKRKKLQQCLLSSTNLLSSQFRLSKSGILITHH